MSTHFICYVLTTTTNTIDNSDWTDWRYL